MTNTCTQARKLSAIIIKYIIIDLSEVEVIIYYIATQPLQGGSIERTKSVEKSMGQFDHEHRMSFLQRLGRAGRMGVDKIAREG
jgi:hypothetical protein